jgi:hypothetical protein
MFLISLMAVKQTLAKFAKVETRSVCSPSARRRIPRPFQRVSFSFPQIQKGEAPVLSLCWDFWFGCVKAWFPWFRFFSQAREFTKIRGRKTLFLMFFSCWTVSKVSL